MLTFVLLACAILLFTLWLHYSQHFQCQFRCIPSSYPLISDSLANLSFLPHNRPKSFDTEKHNREFIDTQMQIARSIRRQQRCCCSIFPIDDEEFDFFPASFLFYIVFIIFLCILISIIDIINYYDNNESIINLLFSYSMKSYHQNSFFGLHSIKSFHSSNILDIILIISILILSMWESLFSFYRYYAAHSVIKYFTETSSIILIKKFICYYAIPFSLIFLIQIYFCYWLFPIVILLHLFFNFFCSWKFASILINRYKLFIYVDKAEAAVQENQHILKAVYYTKYTSLVSCILQSIYLSMFVVTYNVNIAYYLPILWSISCIVNAMNFIRNRLFVQRKMSKSCLYTKRTVQRSHSEQIDNQSPISTESDKTVIILSNTNSNLLQQENTKKALESISIQNQIDVENNEIAKNENNGNYPLKTKILTRQSNSAHILDPKVKLPKLQQTAQSEPIGDFDIAVSTKRQKKALELLGVNDNDRLNHRLSKLKLVKAASINIPAASKPSDYVNMDTDNDLDMDMDMNMDKMEFIDDYELDSSPPFSSIQRQSSIPELTINKPKLSQNKSINQSSSTLRFKLQAMSSNSKRYSSIKHTTMTDLGGGMITKNENLDDVEDENKSDQKTERAEQYLPRSQSINIPKTNQMNFDEVLESFTILAKYGFCTKQSINSVKKRGKRVTVTNLTPMSTANALLNVPNNNHQALPTITFSHSVPNPNMRNKKHVSLT